MKVPHHRPRLEGGDRRLEDDFLLSDIERKNLEAVTTAYHRATNKDTQFFVRYRLRLYK